MELRLIKIVDKVFSARKLLESLGVRIYGNNVFLCPFHDDNHNSAKFYEDANNMYCFAERRVYGSYDMLRHMEFSDKDIFLQLKKSGKLGTIIEEKKLDKVDLDMDFIKDLQKKVLLKKLTMNQACKLIKEKSIHVCEVHPDVPEES